MYIHLVLFLESESKINTADDVDKIISAEIPDESKDPLLYRLVGDSMMHGPCRYGNEDGPCIRDGKCSRYFPKKYVERTIVDENGFPQYKRTNNSRSFTKHGKSLDNRYVVPYNPQLLRMFQGHINVEKTDQSNTIKYLFKYISKGSDRIIAALRKNRSDEDSANHDEVTQYLNCRYLTPCESAWRIFGFPIQHRYPPV